MIISKNLKGILRTLSLIALASLVPSAANADSPDSEITEVKRDFIAIKKQLENVREEALESQTVKNAIANVDETLKAELLAVSPKKSEYIESYFEVRSQLAAAIEAKEETNIEELTKKFDKLITKIKGSLKKATMSESVKQAEQASKDAILAAMRIIDSNTEKLMDEQQELYKRYQQLSKS